MELKTKNAIWERTLSHPAAGTQQCTGSSQTIHPTILKFLLSQPKLNCSQLYILTFYGSFPVLLMDFPFPSRNSSLLSRPYLKVAAVPQEHSGKYEITTKVISGNFTCDELKLCYGKYAASVQQQPWQSKFFFPEIKSCIAMR